MLSAMLVVALLMIQMWASHKYNDLWTVDHLAALIVFEGGGRYTSKRICIKIVKENIIAFG